MAKIVVMEIGTFTSSHMAEPPDFSLYSSAIQHLKKMGARYYACALHNGSVVSPVRAVFWIEDNTLASALCQQVGCSDKETSLNVHDAAEFGRKAWHIAFGYR